MGKKVKFSLDLVISDEKKELVSTQQETTALTVPQPAGVITTTKIIAKRRKRGLVIVLAVIGMLIAGLGGYTLAKIGDNQEEQITKDVNVIDVSDDDEFDEEIFDSDLKKYDYGSNLDIGERIAQFPTDEVTREIINKGYFYELNDVMEDGIFRLEMVAATGDFYNPQLLLDVYVEDEDIVAKNNKIEIYAYCLGEDAYNTQLSNYGQWNAYGEQDKENPHLYHITLPSGIWLSSVSRVVFDMTTIRLGAQTNQWQDYEVSLKTILEIPYDIAFYPACQIENQGLEFTTDTRTYKLYWTDIGYYDTTMEFHFDVEEEQSGNTSEVQLWNQFVKDLVLEVNGVEYKVDSENKGYINSSYGEGENSYYVHTYFPGIKDTNINNVILKYKDIKYHLK